MKASAFIMNFRRSRNAWIPRQSKTLVGGKRKGPNATEAKYLREVIGMNAERVVYQPVPFTLTRTTGKQYTPDFMTVDDGVVTFHEVKGSYHLPTHERARLAWEIAAEANPVAAFVWAELTRKGWEIERWENGGTRILVRHAGDESRLFVEERSDWRKHKPRARR